MESRHSFENVDEVGDELAEGCERRVGVDGGGEEGLELGGGEEHEGVVLLEGGAELVVEDVRGAAVLDGLAVVGLREIFGVDEEARVGGY